MSLVSRVAASAAVLAVLLGATAAHAGRPNTMEACKLCHPAADGVVRGKVVSVAAAQRSLAVTVGPLVWIVKYGDDLEVKEGARIGGPDALRSLARDREVAVTFTGPESRPVATRVAVKQPVELPAEKVVSAERVRELLAGGPGPGKLFLFDSRPAPLFDEGHIPGAISLPYAAFKERAPRLLPADKGTLVVFYCAGETCTLSPFSAREAEALGHRNVKVFRGGLPAWKQAGGLVVTAPAAVERWIQTGHPHVLVDLRDAATVQGGFIPGAGNVACAAASCLAGTFTAERKAPVVLYDAGEASAEAFATVRGWGFVNTSVLAGGRAAWTGETRTGPLAAKIDYVKRLKPGEISVEDFKRIVDARPREVVVLDVRERPVDGALRGAVAIPESELAARAGELPGDRELVIHCNTGILAKRAHELLAAKGRSRTRYLDAVVVVAANGSYAVTEK